MRHEADCDTAPHPTFHYHQLTASRGRRDARGWHYISSTRGADIIIIKDCTASGVEKCDRAPQGGAQGERLCAAGGSGAGVSRPLLHSSVRQVPVLVKPQCMLLRNLGHPLKSSVQQQDFSAH
jgi:hypothetical protein